MLTLPFLPNLKKSGLIFCLDPKNKFEFGNYFEFLKSGKPFNLLLQKKKNNLVFLHSFDVYRRKIAVWHNINFSYYPRQPLWILSVLYLFAEMFVMNCWVMFHCSQILTLLSFRKRLVWYHSAHLTRSLRSLQRWDFLRWSKTWAYSAPVIQSSKQLPGKKTAKERALKKFWCYN